MLKLLRNSLIPIITLVVMIIAGVIVSMAFSPHRITTGSMEPTLPVGTFVFEGPADPLKPGDVITFQQEGEDHPTTHRFIGYAEDGSLMTKGDANVTPDVPSTPLLQRDVIGKVTTQMPLLAPGFWLSQRGALIAGLLVIGGLLFWLGFRGKKDDVQNTESPDESQHLSPA